MINGAGTLSALLLLGIAFIWKKEREKYVKNNREFYAVCEDRYTVK